MRPIEPNGSENELPFSPGNEHDGIVYVSGQVPIDPESGELVTESIQRETEQTLENIESVLKAAGCSREDVLKVTLYITDIGNFDEINEAYASFFNEPYPSRTAFEVSDLAIEAGIEIDAIAATTTE